MSFTKEEILDFEGNTEAVLVSILSNAAGLNLPAFASDTNQNLPIPRIDVVATLMDMGPHEGQLTNGKYVYDQIQISVSISYVFAPDNPDLTKDVRFFRGKMRMLTFYAHQLLETFRDQGIYEVASDSIRETGGIREVDSDEDSVTLESQIELVLFLTPSALSILS